MTTTQPEALRLAEILERPGYGWHTTPAQVAAELRRLAAVEAAQAPKWQPAETAPLDVLVWVSATKRMSGPCIAMHPRIA